VRVSVLQTLVTCHYDSVLSYKTVEPETPAFVSAPPSRKKSSFSPPHNNLQDDIKAQIRQKQLPLIIGMKLNLDFYREGQMRFLAQDWEQLETFRTMMEQHVRRPFRSICGVHPLISLQGWLFKEGGGTSLFGSKSWKKRHFRLKEKVLSWYEDDKVEDPLNQLEGEVEEIVQVHHDEGIFCLEIKTAGRKLFIRSKLSRPQQLLLRLMFPDHGRCS